MKSTEEKIRARQAHYADRCRKIGKALRDLTWIAKEEEVNQILDTLDAFRKDGSQISTVRAVLTSLRTTQNVYDFDRVCTWCSEWLAYHICQPRILGVATLNTNSQKGGNQ